MGTVLVVLGSPVGHGDLGFDERVELLNCQQRVAHSRPAGLDPGVLPRRPRIDVAGSRTAEATPVPQGVGSELRTIVTADEGGAAAGDDAIETGHGDVGIDRVADEVRERLSSELVDNVEDLDFAAMDVTSN